MTQPAGDIDFFISYRGARKDWALWINWVVRSAGYSTILMDEFPAGSTFTSRMRDACQRSRRLIPVYSATYWESGACQEEFDAYWNKHMGNNGARFLLPLMAEDCAVPAMHITLLWKTLLGLEHDAARCVITELIKDIVPVLASSTAYTETEPPFPGMRPAAPCAVDWPDTVPTLRWPLANHDEARNAFATLVTRGSPYRLLAVKGESETGKTHLTRQFFDNARRRVAGCVCGRFDFKGTGDLQASVEAFADHLGVPTPAAAALSVQLSAIYRTLTQRQQPTLLIFDTYESAGEAGRWVSENLLTSLHRSPWLRVIIAGKSVPECHGHPWDEDSETINLHPPSANDWHAWGVKNQRALPLEFAQTAHSACGGKASILTGLFGPL
jgi:hypothetical protein